MSQPKDHLTVTDQERLCLSVEETAKCVGVSKPTIWAEISSGRLAVVRVGRRALVPVASIRAWLRAALNDKGANRPAKEAASDPTAKP